MCAIIDDERRRVGPLGFPWTALEGAVERNPAIARPNAQATDAVYFRLSIHERRGEQEAADTAAALAKVEAAYLALRNTLTLLLGGFRKPSKYLGGVFHENVAGGFSWRSGMRMGG